MRITNNKLLVLFHLLVFTSCEKVLDIDIKDADKKYVIEGTITNVTGQPAEVKISQTKNFDQSNAVEGISSATVSIQVNNGTTYSLTETAPGVYTSPAFTGVPGNTYHLRVNINGELISATSTMPLQTVTLDTLKVDNFSLGGNSAKLVIPNYQDPIGIGNSYRFVQYTNNVLVKKVFVQNDAQSDGLRSTRPLRDNDSDLKSGDIVRIDMLSIDPAVYTYWFSLEQAATGNGSATPANPVSNLSGNVLGYFSAHSVSSKTIVVP
jgi:hypothetical protein